MGIIVLTYIVMKQCNHLPSQDINKQVASRKGEKIDNNRNLFLHKHTKSIVTPSCPYSDTIRVL